ncbi:Tcp11-domain-containing protein [Obba rivulosa]|uniref:Tcp11-domain-containing protein n=1 Tax=Obba rivulosa TaxID=1052685 RepID=A0A8E2AVY8_9APHY|nr:Tcp11-domain-containing protein [Obba rivulosa]
MDNLAHGSAPLQSLTRKRKADAEECAAPDPSSAPDSTDPSATRRCPASPSDRPPARPRALADHDHDMLSPWPDAPAAQSAGAATASAGATASDSPSRPKRPRIEIPQAPPALRRGRRGARSFPLGRLPASAVDSVTNFPRIAETQDTGTILRASEKGPGPALGTLTRRSKCPPIRRSSSNPISTAPDPHVHSPHIPPHSPPINRETLKELDLEAILSNPQLRHDLLFDPGLQFRPTSSRRKRELAENYWLAVVRELETGCTCVTLDAEGNLADRRCICSAFPKPTGRAMIAFPALGNLVTVRVASRIRPLLVELLQTLSTIIQPPVPKGMEQYTPREAANPQVSQNMAHLALLHSVLDADLIEQEIAHKLFNPAAMFDAIGSVVRCHCAPMRDAAVHQMVSLARSCTPGNAESTVNAVRAIRLCFEIMELMKLDVANHQLQALRPYLMKSAAGYEFRAFQEYRQRGELSLDVTREWVQSAHRELVASQALHSDPKSVLYSFNAQNPLIQVTLATIRATVDLIFDPPPRPTVSLTPPSTPYSSPTLRPSYLLASYPGYPETLYLDYTRLATLSAEAADYTALYMLLMLYRQFVHSGPNAQLDRTKDSVSLEELMNLKREIRGIGPQHLGQSLIPRACKPKDINAKDFLKEAREEVRWGSELGAVVLQIARHATVPESRANLVAAEPVRDLQAASPDPKVIKLAQSWAATNVRQKSPLTALMQRRIRDVVVAKVARAIIPLLRKPSVPEGTQDSETTDGLEPLMPELNHLAEKVTKLVTIHMGVYSRFYRQPGFVMA